jgi:hypothetical protein
VNYWLALVLVASAVTVAPLSRAADTWTDPFPGVKRLHRKTSNQNANALVVDLCAPGVSLRATASGEKGKKTSAFASLVGAQAAINGDFFGSGYSTDGMAMSGGSLWGGADHGYVGPIAFGDNKADVIPHEQVAGPEPWMREVVSGHPTILWGGAQRDNNGDPLCSNRHPRTAVGMSADRRTLILAVVDGRKPDRIGMTCDELSALLKELGASDGMNLDGGGSSTMVVGGGVVNYPSDGTERTVGNHLALYASGSGPAVSCPIPAFRGEFVDAGGWPGGTTMTLARGSVATGYLDLKNTGAQPWTPDKTKLGNSEPRDRDSALHTASWLGPNRAATVSQVIQPGEVGRFEFSIRAPDELGTVTEHFALVEEAVTWFADSGGPADDVLWLSVTSVEDTGLGGSGSSLDGGKSGSGGKNGQAQSSHVLEGDPGCGCKAAPSRSSLPLSATLLLMLLALRKSRLG